LRRKERSFVGRATTEEQGPIGGAENFLELIRGLAGGVEAADEAAHAGAGEEVDGDVVLFKTI